MSAEQAVKIEERGQASAHPAGPSAAGGATGHSQEPFVHRAAGHVGGQYSFPQQAQYSSALSNFQQQGRMATSRQQEMFADGSDPASEVASRMNEVRLSCQSKGQQQMAVAVQGDVMCHPHPEIVSQQQDQNGQMKMNPYMGSIYVHGQMHYVQAQPGHLPFSGMPGNYVPVQGMYNMAESNANQASKHNKYCHFCQHVKVRASGMLACCNKDCTRRFCEHCLSKSIGDDVNPQTSSAWESGQWHCPVCRKLCCCAIGECSKNHRHCKAYRYRVRRAEQASKRANGAAAEAAPVEAIAVAGPGTGTAAKGADAASGQEGSAQLPVKAEVVSGSSAVGSDATVPLKASEPPSIAVLSPKNQALITEKSPGGSPGRTAPLMSPKLGSGPMSPSTPSRVARPAQNFEFQDANGGPDSWLELFHDCDEPSYLFQEDGQPRRSNEMLRHQSMTTAMPRTSSKDNMLLPKSTSTDSLSRLLGGDSMLQSISYENLANAANGMVYNTSSDSLSLLQNMTRNISSDSLQGLLPRNYSNSSLQAVLEASEGFQGDLVDQSNAYLQHSTSTGDMDALRSEEAGAKLNVRNYGRVTNMAGPGFSANYEAVSEGLQAAQMAPVALTGKRMNRTPSHNSLVREATRGQEGMIRPASYEKLSRACVPDAPCAHPQP